jgi:cytochrome b561
MQLANSAERYGAISRALHWLTALFVVVAWILGIMNDAFPKGESRTAVLFFHISVGLTIVDLVIMRMLWRYLDPPRPLDPTEFGSWLVAWTDPAGRIVHYCLYLLRAAMRCQFTASLKFHRFGAQIAHSRIRSRRRTRSLLTFSWVSPSFIQLRRLYIISCLAIVHLSACFLPDCGLEDFK